MKELVCKIKKKKNAVSIEDLSASFKIMNKLGNVIQFQ